MRSFLTVQVNRNNLADKPCVLDFECSIFHGTSSKLPITGPARHGINNSIHDLGSVAVVVFEDLRRFSGISAISRLGSRR